MTAVLERASRRTGGSIDEPNKPWWGRLIALIAICGTVLLLASVSENWITGLIVVGIVVAGAVAVSVFSRPQVMVPLAVYSMWFDNTGVGQVKVGRVVSGVVLVLFGLMYLTTSWRPPAVKISAWLPTAGFFGWATLSGYWSEYFGSGYLNSMAQLTLGVAYALVFVWMLRDFEEWDAAIKTFLRIGIPIGALAIFMFFVLGARVSGFTGEPNAFALICILAITLSVARLLETDDVGERRLLYLGILIFVGDVYASGSRGGLIALTVISFYVAALRFDMKPKKRLISALVAGVFGIVGFFVAAAVNPERFGLAVFLGDRGAGRLDIWAAAVAAVKESPYVGIGIGSFRQASFDLLTKVPGSTLDFFSNPKTLLTDGVEAHNMYLSLILDVGFIGLILWTVNHFAIAFRLYKLKTTRWRNYAWALLGTHLYALLGGMLGTSYNAKSYWITTGLSIGTMYYVVPGSASRSARLADGNAWSAGGDPLARRQRISFPWRFSWVVVGVIALAMILGISASRIVAPSKYEASAQVLVVHMDATGTHNAVEIVDNRIQYVMAMAESPSFVRRVIEMSGVEVSYDTMQRAVTSSRARISNLVNIKIDLDAEHDARRVAAVMIPALESVLQDVRYRSLEGDGGNGRDTAPSQYLEYRGPLWLRTNDEPSVTFVSHPLGPTVITSVLSGVLLTSIIGAILHRRLRYSRVNGVEVVPGSAFIGSVPRIARLRKGPSPYGFSALALTIERGAVEGVSVLGVTGPMRGRRRHWVTIGLAGGCAAVQDRQVVIVDLHPSQTVAKVAGCSGCLDEIIEGRASVSDVAAPLRRRRLPRSIRRALPLDQVPLVLGAENTWIESGDPRLVALIDELAEQFLVVLDLDDTPGPNPVFALVSRCDVVIETALDGWTRVSDLVATSNQLRAGAEGRIGLVTLEN